MSLMRKEALSAPARIATRFETNRQSLQRVAERLRTHDFHSSVTVACGSSDHAAYQEGK